MSTILIIHSGLKAVWLTLQRMGISKNWRVGRCWMRWCQGWSSQRFVYPTFRFPLQSFQRGLPPKSLWRKPPGKKQRLAGALWPSQWEWTWSKICLQYGENGGRFWGCQGSLARLALPENQLGLSFGPTGWASARPKWTLVQWPPGWHWSHSYRIG